MPANPSPPTTPITALEFRGGVVRLLDQTRLPLEQVWLEIDTPAAMFEAIRSLRVRGAPAIGVAAAYGAVLSLRDLPADASGATALETLEGAVTHLRGARPTAVNLSWALERVLQAVFTACSTAAAVQAAALEAAHEIERLERETSRRIGEFGAPLLRDLEHVLTHCNTGALATVGSGTALAMIYEAVQQGAKLHVYADETRPLLQGARLTAWELQQAAIPVTVITDSMAAVVLRDANIGAVVVGCDRVAANGDFANKIGTYGLALLARAHAVPFYVAAPTSTLDLLVPDGASIEIEQRSGDEVTHFAERRSAPPGVGAFNPAFDVTPAELVTAFITERGIVRTPYPETLAGLR